MKPKRLNELARRERQVMEILYRQGQATAAEIRHALPDAPSDSAVRAMLRVMEDKGVVKHSQDGPRYVYKPSVPRAQARRSALKTLLDTFFDGSRAQVVAALLEGAESEVSDAELDRLATLIEQARKEGRHPC
ncbi:MAG TPA: BlaI/MecI/CopY family transcriptional regulator [Pirellulales bacterium]|nr:BlaI/MecI/CopY family transcriptional regulator [Pirellulales bacterium]